MLHCFKRHLYRQFHLNQCHSTGGYHLFRILYRVFWRKPAFNFHLVGSSFMLLAFSRTYVNWNYRSFWKDSTLSREDTYITRYIIIRLELFFSDSGEASLRGNCIISISNWTQIALFPVKLRKEKRFGEKISEMDARREQKLKFLSFDQFLNRIEWNWNSHLSSRVFDCVSKSKQ